MALGDTYNNNDGKNDYRVNLYSINSFSNVDDPVEKSKLTYTFWKGLLKVSIAPMVETTDDSVSFDYKNESSIYLSPNLAFMGYKYFRDFIDNPDKLESRSIPTRSGALMKLSKGTPYGVDGIVLVVEKIGEDQNVAGGNMYVFNDKKYYVINNMKEENFSFDKEYCDNLEVEFLLLTLKSFYEYSVGAHSYFNMDYGRFENNRLMGKINKISSALGVEDKSGYNKGYGGKSNSSPFDYSPSNSSNNNSDEYSYEDIEDQLG